jgi:hypothetical protein
MHRLLATSLPMLQRNLLPGMTRGFIAKKAKSSHANSVRLNGEKSVEAGAL